MVGNTMNEPNHACPPLPTTVLPGVTRSKRVTLPDDPRDAAARALAYVQGADSYASATALEAMRERVATHVDPTSPEALRELAEHLPILEALFLRYACESVASTAPDGKSKLLKMSLAAQRAYAQTLALVQGLSLQQQGKAKVIDSGSA
jgi:hypothetical protein